MVGERGSGMVIDWSEDLSDEEYSDVTGSAACSYDSLGDFYAPPSLSMSSIVDYPEETTSDNRPEDYRMAQQRSDLLYSLPARRVTRSRLG